MGTKGLWRWRIATVIALAILNYGWSLPDMSRFLGSPLGSFGFASDGVRVTRLDPGGAAERAGIALGDRISLPDLSPVGHYKLVRGISLHPGDAVVATIVRAGHGQHVRLTAGAESISERLLVALRFLLAFLTAGVAAALLLMRPSLNSWAFFLFCLQAINLPGAVLSLILPWSARTLETEIGTGPSYLEQASGVLFALSFANQRLIGWRLRLLWPAVIGALITATIQILGIGAAARVPDYADAVFSGYVGIAMLAGFIDSHRQEDGAGRQRLKLMIVAVAINVGAGMLAGWLFPSWISYGQYVGLIASQGILPLAAAYAMFRSRVVDIKFIISRTLVLGVLAAIVVAIFSLLDEVIARAFAAADVGIGIDLLVAMVLGFTFNAAHRHTDALLDRLLFRDRHRAEIELENGAAAVIHARDEQTVMHAIVHVPVEALKLTGAAMYRRTVSGYARVAAHEKMIVLPKTLDRDDPLAQTLQADLQPARLDTLPFSHIFDAHASASPVLAVPLASRGELIGFTIYGAHANGADIDPDEVRALIPLVRNAAAALDHLEAGELRSRVAQLETLLERLEVDKTAESAPQTD